MNEISWQLSKYREYEKKIDSPPRLKWTPVIQSKFDSKIYDNISKSLRNKIDDKLSIFLEIYVKIDSEIPEYMTPMNRMPTKQFPNGWIYKEDILDIITVSVSDYMMNNSDVNLEIVKEYYNIITEKKTLLLKDKDNNRVIFDYKLKEEFEEKLLLLIDDEILGILDEGERTRLLREKKLNRILNDLDDE